MKLLPIEFVPAALELLDAGGSSGEDDREVEGALRPKRLEDFTGQDRVCEQLALVLRSAQRRGRAPDHVLMSGPPGLGQQVVGVPHREDLGLRRVVVEPLVRVEREVHVAAEERDREPIVRELVGERGVDGAHVVERD
jgi:replication-associated recombination protein RarA